MIPDPDFTQTCWPSIEAKLGRKMTAEENKKFMYCGGGMFKEWFFNELKGCTSQEQAEKLLASALNRDKIFKSQPQKSKGLFSKLLDWFWQR